MYPPRVKARYEGLAQNRLDKGRLAISLILNWIVGPIYVTILAIAFLHGDLNYMFAAILVVPARYLAAVIVWNELAEVGPRSRRHLARPQQWRLIQPCSVRKSRLSACLSESC